MPRTILSSVFENKQHEPHEQHEQHEQNQHNEHNEENEEKNKHFLSYHNIITQCGDSDGSG